MIFREKKKMINVWLGLLVILLAACAPQQNNTLIPGQTQPSNQPPAATGESMLPSQAVLNAQQWLATQLGVLAENVQVVDVEQVEWTDSCLGLGRANESCAQAITPGWKAVFDVGGRTYEVRTDETGSTIRLAATQGTPAVHADFENIFWSLVSLGSPDAPKQVIPTSNVSLLLSNGTAGGASGCNAYGGSYQVSGNNITFSDLTQTLMACADDAVTQQEQEYVQALQSATTYEVNGNTLLIRYNNGQGVLTFEASAQPIPIPTAY